jgi:hypothetical protein
MIGISSSTKDNLAFGTAPIGALPAGVALRGLIVARAIVANPFDLFLIWKHVRTKICLKPDTPNHLHAERHDHAGAV